MADLAIAKLDLLRKSLSAPRPKPVSKEDTFEAQFTRSVRYPALDKAIAEMGEVIERAMASFDHSPCLSGNGNGTDRIRELCDAADQAAVKTLVVPQQFDLYDSDPLKMEQEIWRDRLDVMQRRAAAAPDETVGAHVECFLKDKEASATAGELSKGRFYILRLHLNHLMDWVGAEALITDINSRALLDYRLELLRHVEAETWSLSTAKDRLRSVKSFVRWLWQVEAIPSLPRIMDGKSILLMLNCGMTQKDIADVQLSEVDWASGRIVRRRSKTRKLANVPQVSYILWGETLRLLRQERHAVESGPALLNENGSPLWHEEIENDGKLKRIDSVGSAFNRLRRKTKIRKPLKSLKKTSATLIRGNGKFSSLERLFLGHAPTSMSDRYYAGVPQELLDEAILWLASEYGIE
jgi:integrase